MATINHPLTGITLNPIVIERKSLDFDEAVTAIILRQSGKQYQQISQMLGTNPHRLGEVFRGEKHPGAADAALRIMHGETSIVGKR